MATPNLLAITTVTPKVLASAQLASGDNTVYTVGSSKAAKLATMTLCNSSTTGSVTVSVSVLPSGSSVDGTHKIVSNFIVEAGESLIVDEVKGMWLGASDFISVNAGTASAIDVALTGLEFA